MRGTPTPPFSIGGLMRINLYTTGFEATRRNVTITTKKKVAWRLGRSVREQQPKGQGGNKLYLRGYILTIPERLLSTMMTDDEFIVLGRDLISELFEAFLIE
ncbi:hypothetical protein PsorP6_013809 [Peronosclerospora sorghi]|uniref:Uncharacterized protein n=1 Tax=Peronosclerospora sorghi TaxID=230839 RepID=A0ACC0VH83_9STRA|nr:hypothetical protein PsorP6_013809 [Peronosclerospora sorghi]